MRRRRALLVLAAGLLAAGPVLPAHASHEPEPEQVVAATITAHWRSLRAERGFLGEPLGELRCDPAVTRCTQGFAGGSIVWEPARGPYLAAADRAASRYAVVNKHRPLPEGYAPARLREVAPGHRLVPAAAREAKALLAAAAEDGVALRVASAYRSTDHQAAAFRRWTRELGAERAAQQSARPRHSEHETGLAMDLLPASGPCQEFGCFAGTEHARWLAEHAYEHGFVVRYQEGQEDVTGFTYEPWHLRFVGEPLARDLRALGSDSLEEHLDLTPAPAYAGSLPRDRQPLRWSGD